MAEAAMNTRLDIEDPILRKAKMIDGFLPSRFRDGKKPIT